MMHHLNEYLHSETSDQAPFKIHKLFYLNSRAENIELSKLGLKMFYIVWPTSYM